MSELRPPDGYSRTTAQHVAAIAEMVAGNANVTNSAIARELARRGMPLSRSVVSRLRRRPAPAPGVPVASPATTTTPKPADDAEAFEAEVLAALDAELVESADGGFEPSGHFSAMDTVVVRKQVAKKLRALMNDTNTPSAVAVKAAGDLAKLVIEIRDAEQRIQRARDHEERRGQ